MKKILGYLRPFAHIYVSTAVLMFLCGALSLGTFPALSLAATLGTALAISGAAWVAYIAIALAICLPTGIKMPGFALSTVIGVVSGSAAIALVGWLIPGTVLTIGFLAATPFALVNTLAIWGSARLTGSMKKDMPLWPQR